MTKTMRILPHHDKILNTEQVRKKGATLAGSPRRSGFVGLLRHQLGQLVSQGLPGGQLGVRLVNGLLVGDLALGLNGHVLAKLLDEPSGRVGYPQSLVHFIQVLHAEGGVPLPLGLVGQGDLPHAPRPALPQSEVAGLQRDSHRFVLVLGFRHLLGGDGHGVFGGVGFRGHTCLLGVIKTSLGTMPNVQINDACAVPLLLVSTKIFHFVTS